MHRLGESPFVYMCVRVRVSERERESLFPLSDLSPPSPFAVTACPNESTAPVEARLAPSFFLPVAERSLLSHRGTAGDSSWQGPGVQELGQEQELQESS